MKDQIPQSKANAASQRKNSALAWIICGLAGLFYVYDYFIQVAPSVMTHQLMVSFQIGSAGLGLLGSFFYYSYTAMQIPAGLLLDRYGARKLLTAAIAISAVGVLLFAHTYLFMLAGFSRLLVGLGSSFAFVSSLYLAANWFSHRYFAMIAGFVQFGGALGSIIGLAPLAIWINHQGWREALWTAGLFTLVFAIVVWLVVRDHQPNTAPAQPVTHSDQSIWQDLKQIIAKRQMWWIAATGLLTWIPVVAFGALWGVPYLMRVYGLSNTGAGKIMALFWLGLGIGSPFVGWLSNRISRRRSPVLLCFTAGFFASLIILFAPALPLWLIGSAIFLLGAASAVQSLSFGFVKDIIPSRLFATAAGFNNMAAILGGAITQPLVGIILHYQWQGAIQNGARIYSIHAFQTAFVILPTASALGIIVASLFLVETYARIREL